MRNKNGFTLAEILIVLMVLGVIAMLTIPSLMKGTNEAQLKAGYKKAYNTIMNVSAMEKTAGALPTKRTAAQLADYYEMLVANLSIKNFIPYTDDSTGANTSGNKAKSGPTNTCVKIVANNVTLGSKKNDSDCLNVPAETGLGNFPWIITDDGIAYTIMAGGTGNAQEDCDTKSVINAQASHADAVSKSCVVIITDVNGLAKGPNDFEQQKLADGTSLGPNNAPSGASMTQLIGDDYYIYVGSDGAAAGNPSTTISGRIVTDLK